MDVLRTPDERFTNLPGYAFTPHYLEVDGLRIHHVDEGPRGAPPVLLLHGEPSWSYLYRRMIPLLTAAGFRAVAPDLVGFGRSDKPASPADYTYQRHVDWMHGVLEALDLRGVTLVCQDWGGLIGLRLAAERADGSARPAAHEHHGSRPLPPGGPGRGDGPGGARLHPPHRGGCPLGSRPTTSSWVAKRGCAPREHATVIPLPAKRSWQK